MTPQELARLLTPQVQEAAERSKSDILASLSPINRIVVKTVWDMAMKTGVPAANRIVIELLVARYRSDLEPLIGPIVNNLIQSLDQEAMPQFQMLRNVLEVLHTPTAQFHPAVQACIDPNLQHTETDYDG